MRNFARFAVAVVLVVALGALIGCGSGSGSGGSGGYGGSTTPSSTGSSAGGASVAIKDFAFDPATVSIKVGEQVTFTNNDSVAHTVNGDGFESGNIAPGATWSKTFDKAGTFDYKCSIHPTMAGSITVQ